jgi:hypothetical protein
MSQQALRIDFVAPPKAAAPVRHEKIFALLQAQKFGPAVWRQPIGHLWSLVGEIGDVQVIVTCFSSDLRKFYLQVQSPRARQWLLDFLAANDCWDVDVVVAPLPAESEGAPWVALTVVVGAVALFGWVVSSIHILGG